MPKILSDHWPTIYRGSSQTLQWHGSWLSDNYLTSIIGQCWLIKHHQRKTISQSTLVEKGFQLDCKMIVLWLTYVRVTLSYVKGGSSFQIWRQCAIILGTSQVETTCRNDTKKMMHVWPVCLIIEFPPQFYTEPPNMASNHESYNILCPVTITKENT
jgi:hypothetical protein